MLACLRLATCLPDLQDLVEQEPPFLLVSGCKVAKVVHNAVFDCCMALHKVGAVLPRLGYCNLEIR